MKILFISPQVPWPLDAGSKIRIHNLIAAYSSIGDVTLMCLAQDATESASVSRLECVCERVICFPLRSNDDVSTTAHGDRGSFTGRLRSMFENAWNPSPRIARAFHAPDFEREVALASRTSFDVVHVERLSMVPFARAALVQARAGDSAPLRVLDIDDIESRKTARASRLYGWGSRRRALLQLEAAKLARFERRALSHFDVTLVCSDVDRRWIQERHQPHGALEIFRNGTNVPGTEPAEEDDGRTITFLGAMGYGPNEDAAVHFAMDVFPLIKAQVPNARFIIAGKSPSPRVAALADGQNVLVTGYVRDTNALLRASTVVVVPLRVGGGTRIKILEAWAMRRPVVSTSVGFEGIDAVPDEHLLLADTVEAFASACVTLLTDVRRRRELGGAGHRLAATRYQWEQIRQEFAAAVTDAIENQRRVRK